MSVADTNSETTWATVVPLIVSLSEDVPFEIAISAISFM